MRQRALDELAQLARLPVAELNGKQEEVGAAWFRVFELHGPTRANREWSKHPNLVALGRLGRVAIDGLNRSRLQMAEDVKAAERAVAGSTGRAAAMLRDAALEFWREPSHASYRAVMEARHEFAANEIPLFAAMESESV